MRRQILISAALVTCAANAQPLSEFMSQPRGYQSAVAEPAVDQAFQAVRRTPDASERARAISATLQCARDLDRRGNGAEDYAMILNLCARAVVK